LKKKMSSKGVLKINY